MSPTTISATRITRGASCDNFWAARPLPVAASPIADSPKGNWGSRGVANAGGGSHHPHALLLAADLGFQSGGADVEHLPRGLAAGSSKLDDAHAARLQLTGPGRYLVPVTPPLLLRTS